MRMCVVLNPWTQIAQRKLGNEEGIWARENGEGGNRWQIGGAVSLDSIYLQLFSLGDLVGRRSDLGSSSVCILKS